MLSIARSIAALAVGFSLSLPGISSWIPAVVIGIFTAGLTVIGMLLGRKIGTLWGGRVEIIGGIALIGQGDNVLNKKF